MRYQFCFFVDILFVSCLIVAYSYYLEKVTIGWF